MERAYSYDTIIGKILITEEEDEITGLSVLSGGQELSEEDKKEDKKEDRKYEIAETKLIKEAARQFNEYLQGDRKEFDLRINPRGTEFQRKVWEALRAIPYGETRSYKQIAEAVGNDKASRAVGMANHNNPILCIIPCHRVIGADGRLVGFGAGLPVKEHLLAIERSGNHKQE